MRLIDADRAKNSSDNKHDANNFFTDYRTIDDVRRFLDLQPTVEAEPVIHAHWIDSGYNFMNCSNCKAALSKERMPYARYCLYCGAKMDEVTEK